MPSRYAKNVQPEYVDKTRKVDQRFNGTPPNADPGPMESLLVAYGDIMPLVFGWYGEVNKAFEQLLGVAAQLGSLRLHTEMNCHSPLHAKGVLMWKLRRDLAAAIGRANMNFLFARRALLVGDVAAAQKRLADARRRFFRSGDPSHPTYSYDRSRYQHYANAWRSFAYDECGL